MPASAKPVRPPVLLLVSLIALWLLGVHAIVEGVRVIDIVQNPLAESLAAVEGNDLTATVQRAFIVGTEKQSGNALPIGVAQLLLGALLAALSLRALLGRHGSRSLLLQVLVANSALVAASYALAGGVRHAVVGAVVAELEGQRPPDLDPAEFVALASANVRWAFRIWLMAQLLAYAVIAFVITRRSMLRFFATRERG